MLDLNKILDLVKDELEIINILSDETIEIIINNVKIRANKNLILSHKNQTKNDN